MPWCLRGSVKTAAREKLSFVIIYYVTECNRLTLFAVILLQKCLAIKWQEYDGVVRQTDRNHIESKH
jgi:hypothetical protein